MKKLLFLIKKGMGIFAAFILVIAVLSGSTACFMFFYQPKVPDGMKSRKLIKSVSE